MCDWISDREPTIDDIPQVYYTWVTAIIKEPDGYIHTTVKFMCGQTIRLAWQRWYYGRKVLAWQPQPQPWTEDNDEQTTKLAIALFKHDDEQLKKHLSGE